MTTHASITAGCSQCDRILDLLQQANGAWVAMPFLSIKSRSYNVHSRISDLRKRGHEIKQRSERRNGEIHSSYRLVTQPLDLIPARDG